VASGISPIYFAVVFAALLPFGTIGCNSVECDVGQELRRSYCYDIVYDAIPPPDAPPSSDGVPNAEAGDAGSTNDSGSDMCPADAGDQIGTPCTDGVDHSDCDCTAPYCAISPGMSEGYCTRTGCLDVPDICPDGYSCLDLSIFNPELPSICSAGS